MDMRLAKMVLIVVSTCFLGPRASALVVERMSLLELSREADLVVRARVAACKVRRSARGRLVTDVTVDVLEVLKGRLDALTLVFEQPGGVLGGRGQVVPGVPRLAVGEEVVLFLGPEHDRRVGKRRLVIGLCLGIFKTYGREGQVRVRQAIGPGVLVLGKPDAPTPRRTSLDLPLSRLRKAVHSTGQTTPQEVDR